MYHHDISTVIQRITVSSNTSLTLVQNSLSVYCVAMSTLFQALRPESQIKKEFAVSGYIREQCKVQDIAKICLLFCDEVINWTIDFKVKYSIMDNPESTVFICNGIKFKCLFDPDVELRGQRGHAIIWLKAFLPKDIKSIKFFFTMYCRERDALFQRVVKLSNDENPDKWIKEDFWLLIDCKKYDEIYLNHYIDILQICYNDKRKDYNKDIKMSIKSKYEWIIDRALLDKFKTALLGQYFVSDVFDALNQNFCLRLYPNSYHKFYTVPSILRLPHNISRIMFESKITNNLTKFEEKTTFELTHQETSLKGTAPGGGKNNDIDIFHSVGIKEVLHLDQFIINVEFKIIKIYSLDDPLKEIPTENWAAFNVL